MTKPIVHSPAKITIARKWRPATERQRKQRALFQALGSVKGFHGYLRMLESALDRTEIFMKDHHFDIAELHRTLYEYEIELRIELTKMRLPK